MMGRLQSALRDAGLSALVALGLFCVPVGLRLDPGPVHLLPTPRPVLLAGLVATVFVLRLGWLLAGAARWPTPRGWPRTRIMRWFGPALVAGALVLPAIAGRYWVDLGTLILIYVMLGWGLSITVGLAGLLDLGYVAFYAVGAYATAILSTRYGLGFWTCLPLAGLLAAVWGLCVGFPVLRLRGDYLAIVTLAFGEIVRVLLINGGDLTGGPNGIGGIARPTLFGLTLTGSGPGSFAGLLGVRPNPLQRIVFLYYVILGLDLLTGLVCRRLRRLPLGRAMEALREDETACRALGINVTVTKLTAFAIGASFGGLAGAFFATRAAFVSPESFTFLESALVLAIVVLGGLGSQVGTALAAIVMIGGSELLRDFAQYRMLVFGLGLIAMMVMRPSGLMGGRVPSLRAARLARP